MIRTVQLGPEDMPLADIVALFGNYYQSRFKIPMGATLLYASAKPPLNTAPTWVRMTLYQSRRLDDSDFESLNYVYQLVPNAYAWSSVDLPHAVTWEGSHRVDDNFEHTLEILVFDGTGASGPIWSAMAIVEVIE